MRDTRRARLVLTILLLVAFSLVTLDYRSGAFGGVRSAASTVFGPIENAADDVVSPVGSFFSSIGHLSSYKHDNQQLKRQLATSQELVHSSDGLRRRLTELQRIDRLAGTAGFHIVHARVEAVGSGLGFEDTATIDIGSRNGIQAQQTVIDADGLVGKVESVGRSTATVLLASDPKFTVGAREEKTGELGQVTGGGRGAMTLELFGANAQLAVGDRLVTAGIRPFVPEVPIGHVTSVTPATGSLGRIGAVVSYVDFSSLDDVAVVVGSPAHIKHDILLPAPPKPTPTVTVTVTAPPSSSSTPSPGTSSSPGATTSGSP